MRSFLSKCFLLAALLATGAVQAQSPDLLPALGSGRVTPASSPVSASAVASHTQVTAGQTFFVAIDVRIRPPYVLYSASPGDNGEVTVLPASLTANVGPLKAGEILWPPSVRHEAKLLEAKLVNNVYQGRAIVLVPVTAPAGAADGNVVLSFRLDGQACGEDRCVMLDDVATLTASVTVGPAAVANPAWTAEYAAAVEKAHPSRTATTGEAPPPAGDVGLWAGLGSALLAGLLLNIMPCVLPVVPLRILSIVQMARDSRRRYVTLGMAFALGMVGFFALLAATNVAIRLATGQTLDWGQHFQLSSVRTALALLVVAMAANLFGLFTVLVPRSIAGIESRGQGHLASAGMGFMMAVLATPCSFAFLLAAFSWAVGQSLLIGSAALVLMGVGMAAPHALLAAFPPLVSRLPKPGRWMELLRQSMGFVLLGAAVWLISTVTEPFWTAGYAIALCFPLWMWGSWVRYDTPKAHKIFIRSLAVVIALGAGIVMLKPVKPGLIEFQPYDAARIVSAADQGRPVLVKFSASWCLSCQLLEMTVYDDKDVAAELQKLNFLAMKGDVTNPGPARAMLHDRFKAAVPLTVIYPPRGGKPVFLTGEFTKNDLIAALRAAAQQ